MENDPNEVEDFLAHYGVKGMKWGVHKKRDSYSTASARSQKKDLRETRKAKNSAALKKAGDAEKRSEEVFESIKRENKKKGMGTMAADRAAFKDPRYQKAAAKAAKADDRYISEAKKNRAEYKQGVKDIRVDKMDWNKKTAGEKAVSYMFQPAAKTRNQRMEAKDARRSGTAQRQAPRDKSKWENKTGLEKTTTFLVQPAQKTRQQRMEAKARQS